MEGMKYCQPYLEYVRPVLLSSAWTRYSAVIGVTEMDCNKRASQLAEKAVFLSPIGAIPIIEKRLRFSANTTAYTTLQIGSYWHVLT